MRLPAGKLAGIIPNFRKKSTEKEFTTEGAEIYFFNHRLPRLSGFLIKKNTWCLGDFGGRLG
jgi:hypothetical protein